jgi:hypothetical protein
METRSSAGLAALLRWYTANRKACSAAGSPSTSTSLHDHRCAQPASCFGDEGGIVCRLDFGDEAKNAAFVSITHLRFDARLPLAREITAYQKHRVKRLQRRSA